MSIKPSYRSLLGWVWGGSENSSQWSIHTSWVPCRWIQSPSLLLARTCDIFRFLTMILLEFARLSSTANNSPVEPTPTMVLSEATRTISLPVVPVILPDTWIIKGPELAAALSRSARVDTVTVAPPLPPVVTPAAKPNNEKSGVDWLTNVAVTVLLAFIVTWTGLLVLVTSPLQLENTNPDAGAAVRVTTVPEA